MLTLYKRGPVFWLRGTLAGRRIHRSTGTAEPNIAEQIRADTEAREWKSHIYGPEAVLTFGQAAIMYLKAGRSPRFLTPIIAHWKDTPVKEIKPGAIRQSAVVLYPGGSAATRNRQVISPTQAIINHAAEAGLCHPVRVRRFPVQKTIKQISTLEWIYAFTAAAAPKMAALAWFMFLSGSRITPAVRLTWADVDLSKAEAILRKPKGQDDARVHLPTTLIAALANIPGERLSRGKVFGYSSRNAVYPLWRRVCKRAGLPYISPHPAGRHGFATGLLREGVDPITVAKLGHWKTPRHVFETYGHAIEDRTLTDRLLKGKR